MNSPSDEAMTPTPGEIAPTDADWKAAETWLLNSVTRQLGWNKSVKSLANILATTRIEAALAAEARVKELEKDIADLRRTITEARHDGAVDKVAEMVRLNCEEYERVRLAKIRRASEGGREG